MSRRALKLCGCLFENSAHFSRNSFDKFQRYFVLFKIFELIFCNQFDALQLISFTISVHSAYSIQNFAERALNSGPAPTFTQMQAPKRWHQNYFSIRQKLNDALEGFCIKNHV